MGHHAGLAHAAWCCSQRMQSQSALPCKMPTLRGHRFPHDVCAQIDWAVLSCARQQTGGRCRRQRPQTEDSGAPRATFHACKYCLRHFLETRTFPWVSCSLALRATLPNLNAAHAHLNRTCQAQWSHRHCLTDGVADVPLSGARPIGSSECSPSSSPYM